MVFFAKKNSFYLFGGLTVTNETLNDMWRYSITENSWEKVQQYGEIPMPRCGHSFSQHNGKAFLFGGLIEVTQESNETLKFDLETHTWEEIGSSGVGAQINASRLNEYMNKKESTLDATIGKESFCTNKEQVRPDSSRTHAIDETQMFTMGTI